MSENGETNPSGSHNQSRTVSSAAGELQGGDVDTGIIQSETIKQLDDVVIEYSAQWIVLHMAFKSIHTVLSENPTLTDEQCAQSFKLYEGRLEQAAATRVQAIT